MLVWLVWFGLGFFANNVSALPFFLCISVLSCCFRLSVLVSEGAHSMTPLPVSQVQTFWQSLQGQRTAMLVTLLALDLHKMQLCPFFFYPCESHGSVCKEMFSLPLVIET